MNGKTNAVPNHYALANRQGGNGTVVTLEGTKDEDGNPDVTGFYLADLKQQLSTTQKISGEPMENHKMSA